METKFFFALFPILSLIFLVTWHYLDSLWLRPRKLEKCLRDQGFTGNPYRWITGDLVLMGQMTRSALSKPISCLSHDIVPRIMPFLHYIVNQYGMKSFIWYGRRPRVNIAEPEIIKEIFTKWNIFQKENPTGKASSNFGLAMREGENWVKVRRILNPAFHVEKLKYMLPMMELSCEVMLSKWEEILAPRGSGEVDVLPFLTTMTSDVISRTAFGSSYEQGKTLFKLQNEQVILMLQTLRSVGNYLPGWRHMPTKKNQMKKKLDREIQSIINDMVNKRKEATKTGEHLHKNDLLGIMLESNEKEIQEHGSGMTTEDVIQECKLFYLAGAETTSSLLTWTLVLLSKHQEWQVKAREEILLHLGKDKKPHFETLGHLKTVTMILNEVLRFYPPITSLSRMIHQETRLKHLSFASGMEFNLPIVLLHRDKQLWGNDAHEFNPARFEQGVSNAAKVPGSFFPFGGGPRVCIGQNFALIEAKLALSMILQRFHFEISPSYVHAPQCRISMEPQFGALLILHKA